MCRQSTAMILHVFLLIVLHNVLCNDGVNATENTIEDMLPEKRDEGMTGRLNCTVTREDDAAVTWQHHMDPELELTRNDAVVVDDALNPTLDGGRKKYEVEYLQEDDGRETFQLVINNVQVSDKGAYACSILPPANGEKISKNGHLWVQVPPSIVIAETSTIVSVLWYRDIELMCSASGVPTPKVTWTRVFSEEFPEPYSGQTEVDGPKLKLTRVLKEDYGIYRCTASNGIGQAVTHDVVLYVESSPTVTPLSTDYYHTKGSAAILECRVAGYPEMVTRWRRWRQISSATPDADIEYMQASAKYAMQTTRNDSKIVVGNRNATVYISQLRISDVEADDFGVYECHADNKLGIATANVSLHECTESMCDDEPASGCTVLLPSCFLGVLLLGLLPVL